MNTHTQSGIFATKWDAERNQAEAELCQLERERALEDIVRLIRRFELTFDEIQASVGPLWGKRSTPEITPFEPYFGGRGA